MQRKKPASKTAAKPAKAAASAKFKRSAAAGRAPSPALPASNAGSAQILAELKGIRILLLRERSTPHSGDKVLESGVTSIRRLLSELMEKQTDWILARLVALRETAADSPRVTRALDALLDELGAVRFRAESLDCVDPLVHTVVEERPVTNMTEGLIIETIRPGYRTVEGTVLAKACVAISRRN